MNTTAIHTEPATTPALPATLRLGAVHLTVTDLDRSVAWYERALGVRLHGREAGSARLGDGVETAVVLHEDTEARPAGRHAGLYHYALLYPTREALARAALRLAATRTPIQGASDHGTHEAIYLPDPDGNGIELAADRSREEWPTPEEEFSGGGPRPLDFDSLLSTAPDREPGPSVAEGLRMGHVHLHVGDVAQGLAFYRDVLGFEVWANIGSAAFVSAGGYHHHVAFNTWRGHGVGPAPEHTVGLRRFTVQLPTDDDVAAVRARVEAAGVALQPLDGGFLVRDPWQTPLAMVSTAATGLRSRAVVATRTPSRYLLQLAKHFRHKLEVRFDEQHAVIPLAGGHAQLEAGEDALVMTAFAHTPADLARVERVLGSHLERFAHRDELRVSWTREERRP